MTADPREQLEPVPGGWPESARVAAIAALDKRAMLGALDISVGDAWLLVTDILNAVALPIAAAVLRNWGASHEHAWTRCEQCKVTGPCACAGGACCPGERRENEARAEGSADERERIAAWLEREAARLDESGFDPSWNAPVVASYGAAAAVIRSGMLEGP